MTQPWQPTPLLRPLRGRPRRATPPSLRLERSLWDAGLDVVVGVDEVGRGSWAGPLVVGAAVLPQSRRVNGVRDSKLLTEAERERLFAPVSAWCTAWAIGAASHTECDELGMTAAQKLAAGRAIAGLGVTPDQVLVDGNWDFVGLGCTQRVIKGDAACLSIAAASVLAKVSRDRMMRAQAPDFPGFDFEANKGYPLPEAPHGAPGLRADRPAPSELDLHGEPAVGCRRPAVCGSDGGPVVLADR